MGGCSRIGSRARFTLVVRAHGDAAENGKFSREIKKPQLLAVKGLRDGVPGRIRTCDAGIRSPYVRCLGRIIAS